MRPRSFVATHACVVAACLLVAAPARAVGRLVDVQIVDRATGENLRTYRHRGEWWVAGRPGARYAVTVLDRSGQRTLNVVSVDGVNAITGDTAAWSQSGYVLDPWTRVEVDGWRKSMEQVAAFEFTALPDSYAARTGRPANVGVIGVAVFTERRRMPAPLARKDGMGDDVARAKSSAEPTTVPTPSPAERPAAPAPSADARNESASADMSNRAFGVRPDRLGTGHGAVEDSAIRWVRFERDRSTPSETVVIRYDRMESLIAMGIVPTAPLASSDAVVDPFPGSRRFVPDPPPR